MDVAAPQLEAALASAGMENISLVKETVSLGGVEHPGLRLSGVMNGTEIFELIAVQKQGRYMATYTAASVLNDNADQVFEAWSLLDDGTAKTDRKKTPLH